MFDYTEAFNLAIAALNASAAIASSAAPGAQGRTVPPCAMESPAASGLFWCGARTNLGMGHIRSDRSDVRRAGALWVRSQGARATSRVQSGRWCS